MEATLLPCALYSVYSALSIKLEGGSFFHNDIHMQAGIIVVMPLATAVITTTSTQPLVQDHLHFRGTGIGTGVARAP